MDGNLVGRSMLCGLLYLLIWLADRPNAGVVLLVSSVYLPKRTDHGGRRFEAPPENPGEAAASVKRIGGGVSLARRTLRSAAIREDDSVGGAAAPVHGQTEAGPQSAATARRLVMTSPSPAGGEENPGKRSRGESTATTGPGADSPHAGKRPSLAEGLAASGLGQQSSSIPSKSRRVPGVDVERGLASHLPVKESEGVVGQTLLRGGYAGNASASGAAGVAGGGAQAVCGRPLVPRPSSPRTQGACHPW